ncbi:MAG: hypothetical protein FJY85_01935 [Deltaproteobacteria bacterium]|nr:hypothetical protein [Deltaproteobacteria bacterium]
MDLDKTKELCGTCDDWKGKREKGVDGIIRVSPSTRGLCEKLEKQKPPHGGCDQWTLMKEVDYA